MPNDGTLTEALRAVLDAHEVPASTTLAADLMAAVANCIAASAVTVQGVPLPIDLAMALVDRGVLKVEVMQQEEE